ncbi:hypothetical protein PG984_007094 [Apiospora sp. TS-2023a]
MTFGPWATCNTRLDLAPIPEARRARGRREVTVADSALRAMPERVLVVAWSLLRPSSSPLLVALDHPASNAVDAVGVFGDDYATEALGAIDATRAPVRISLKITGRNVLHQDIPPRLLNRSKRLHLSPDNWAHCIGGHTAVFFAIDATSCFLKSDEFFSSCPDQRILFRQFWHGKLRAIHAVKFLKHLRRPASRNIKKHATTHRDDICGGCSPDEHNEEMAYEPPSKPKWLEPYCIHGVVIGQRLAESPEAFNRYVQWRIDNTPPVISLPKSTSRRSLSWFYNQSGLPPNPFLIPGWKQPVLRSKL